MNRDVKKLWLEALRGGEYRQARSELRSATKGWYCCLGVLCDLHRKAHPGTFTWKRKLLLGSADGKKRWWHLDEVGELPFEVRQWAGLSGADPTVAFGQSGESRALSDINDSGSDFEVIANLIEEQL